LTRGSGTTRPKLLFLSQVLPFPPDGGVKIRTFNVLRLLARTFDITALCFYRSKGGLLNTDVASALRGLEPLARVEAFPIPQDQSRSRLLWDHIRSVLNRRAYTVFSYQSPEFEERLRELLFAEHFDLVHADSLDLSYYFPLLRGIPLACTHHDAQSALLARRANLESSAPRRAYFRLQSRLMKIEEALWCPQVALNVAVSKVDASKLGEITPTSRFLVVPNGVDTDYFHPTVGAERIGIVSVGGTTWYPNKDSLDYFVAEILPRLRAKGMAEPVTWVGRASEDEIDYYRREHGITMTGYVEDVRPYVQSAACYVVPIRMGGGTRVKILDAWAMGVPIVSTAIGCEGLAAVDGQNILVRDDPELFADSVLGLLANGELGTRLGTAGRATAELHYSWDALEPILREAYLALE
jgi:glycosyltransferase involved in cell wall biosynthesis